MVSDCTTSTDLFGNRVYVHGLTLFDFESTYFPNGAIFPGPGMAPCPTSLSPQNFAANGCSAAALFINAMDLNFSRKHMANMGTFPTGLPYTGAIVCNYKGSDFYHTDPNDPLSAVLISSALNNAQLGLDPLPCVVLEYSVQFDANEQPLNGGKPFVRFLVFSSQSEQLMDAVDLDGRGPKAIPDSCSACHGTPFGTDGSQSDGASFIPFDEGNFLFSTQMGLTRSDQETQIKNLNLIVLNTSALQAQAVNGPSQSSTRISHLIHGWYDTYNYDALTCTQTVATALDSPSQQLYLPPALLQNANCNGGGTEANVYFDIWAPSCRSCHVSNGIGIKEPLNPGDLAGILHDPPIVDVCNPGQGTHPPTGLVMPNSKIAFDRFWTGANLPRLLQRYLGQTCNLLNP